MHKYIFLPSKFFSFLFFSLCVQYQFGKAQKRNKNKRRRFLTSLYQNLILRYLVRSVYFFSFCLKVKKTMAKNQVFTYLLTIIITLSYFSNQITNFCRQICIKSQPLCHHKKFFFMLFYLFSDINFISSFVMRFHNVAKFTLFRCMNHLHRYKNFNKLKELPRNRLLLLQIFYSIQL